jgi:hypothetical protein
MVCSMTADGSPLPRTNDAPAGWQLTTWLAELLSVPVGLVDAYLPAGRGVSARTREQLIVAVAEVNGNRYTAWVHGSWVDLLGPRELDEALVPLFEYAKACAQAGVPLDTTVLEAAYPAALVRSLRATVAQAELSSLVGSSIAELGARVTARRRWSLGDVVQSASTLAFAVPIAVPTVIAAAGMRTIARLAPSLPTIQLPPDDEANLVVHLLAEAAPTYLGHAFIRTGLLYSPMSLAIAFRMDGTAATIRIGRGRVAVDNGVQPDALLVVDGGIEPLLQTVTSSILRDLGFPLRRS